MMLCGVVNKNKRTDESIWLSVEKNKAHSIGFSGRQMGTYVEGSSTDGNCHAGWRT
jgi:hypothetical protein